MGEGTCLLLQLNNIPLPLLVGGVDCRGAIDPLTSAITVLKETCDIIYVFLGYIQTSCLLGGDPGVPFIVGRKAVGVTNL